LTDVRPQIVLANSSNGTIYNVILLPMAVEDLGPLTVRVPMNMLLILASADCTVFVFRLFAPDLREEELIQQP